MAKSKKVGKANKNAAKTGADAKTVKADKQADVKIVDKAETKKPVKPDAKKPDVKADVNKADVKKETKTLKFDKVAKGHLVSVEYKGTLDNGEEFDNSAQHGPIKFVAGKAQVIKGFDEAVVGMKLNDRKTIKIQKENAYGDVNPQLVQKIPLQKLPPELKEKVKIGGFLMLQAPTGQHIPAKVTAMDKDFITLDLNHPLAGKNLNFDIKIVDITEAPDCDCNDKDCGPECNC